MINKERISIITNLLKLLLYKWNKIDGQYGRLKPIIEKSMINKCIVSLSYITGIFTLFQKHYKH